MNYIQSILNIGLIFKINFEHEETTNEHESYLKFSNPPKKKLKKETKEIENENQKKIQNSIERKEFEDLFFKKKPHLNSISNLVSFKIKIESNSIYLTGNYNKFERGISQTEWIVNNQKLAENSIDEFISKPIIEITKSNEYLFHSSGREDVDVRMLGNGRPFLIELKNSKFENLNEIQMKEIMKKINENERIGINSLKMTKESILKEIHESSQEKKKKYRFQSYLSNQISKIFSSSSSL